MLYIMYVVAYVLWYCYGMWQCVWCMVW